MQEMQAMQEQVLAHPLGQIVEEGSEVEVGKVLQENHRPPTSTLGESLRAGSWVIKE